MRHVARTDPDASLVADTEQQRPHSDAGLPGEHQDMVDRCTDDDVQAADRRHQL